MAEVTIYDLALLLLVWSQDAKRYDPTYDYVYSKGLETHIEDSAMSLFRLTLVTFWAWVDATCKTGKLCQASFCKQDDTLYCRELAALAEHSFWIKAQALLDKSRLTIEQCLDLNWLASNFLPQETLTVIHSAFEDCLPHINSSGALDHQATLKGLPAWEDLTPEQTKIQAEAFFQDKLHTKATLLNQQISYLTQELDTISKQGGIA